MEKTIHLSHPGRYCAGLGDAVTWAWLANGSVPLSFWAEGRNREMLEFLGCRMADSPEGSIDPHDAYGKELGERCGRPRAVIWSEFLGIPCEPKRPEFKLNQVGYLPRRVLLCPNTHFKPREWPPAYWMDLNWKLRDANVDVVWLMEHQNDLNQYSQRGPSMAYYGLSMRDCAALMSSAAVVVANDSMPAHLAGTVGRPTLAMMGPTHRNVFWHMPDVMPMHSEIVDCAGCHFGQPFRASCDMMCGALATLLPGDVAKTVLFILEKLNVARRVSASVSADEAAKSRDQRRGA